MILTSVGEIKLEEVWYIKELNKIFVFKMRFKIIVFILSSTFVISCDENKNTSNKNVEDAFAKIDKKNESLFTKEIEKSIIKSLLVLLKKTKNPLQITMLPTMVIRSSPRKKI